MVRKPTGTSVLRDLGTFLIALTAQAQPRGGIPVRPVQLGYCTAVAVAATMRCRAQVSMPSSSSTSSGGRGAQIKLAPGLGQ